MIPKRNSNMVEIPLTFDGSGRSRATRSSMLLFSFLILVGWLVVTVVAVFATETWMPKLIVPLIAGYVGFMLLRFAVVRESMYFKRREQLAAKDYMFEHDVFWNIHDISEQYPYIVSFANGAIGVYVALDKDVIVGRGEDAKYFHHEAIAEAERQMVSRKIECMHIDYMDTVGKDKRMEGLFEMAAGINSPLMKQVVTRMYDNLEINMNIAYASYDVYCFVYKGRPETFWAELQVVLDYFKKANYIRWRVLDKTAIGYLVDPVLNIEGFSVNNACDTLYRKINKMRSLRVIWTSKNGETTKVNPTFAEMAEMNRIRETEKKMKAKRRFSLRKKKDDLLFVPAESEESESRKSSASKSVEEVLRKRAESPVVRGSSPQVEDVNKAATPEDEDDIIPFN